jgi:hypothetical protein
VDGNIKNTKNMATAQFCKGSPSNSNSAMSADNIFGGPKNELNAFYTNKKKKILFNTDPVREDELQPVAVVVKDFFLMKDLVASRKSFALQEFRSMLARIYKNAVRRQNLPIANSVQSPEIEPFPLNLLMLFFFVVEDNKNVKIGKAFSQFAGSYNLLFTLMLHPVVENVFKKNADRPWAEILQETKLLRGILPRPLVIYFFMIPPVSLHLLASGSDTPAMSDRSFGRSAPQVQVFEACASPEKFLDMGKRFMAFSMISRNVGVKTCAEKAYNLFEESKRLADADPELIDEHMETKAQACLYSAVVLYMLDKVDAAAFEMWSMRELAEQTWSRSSKMLHYLNDALAITQESGSYALFVPIYKQQIQVYEAAGINYPEYVTE